MFVDYHFKKSETLPAIGQNLYEYVVGSNGCFVRAKRKEMEAMIKTGAFLQPLRGLKRVEAYLKIEEQVPAKLVGKMFEMAFRAGNREILFYLTYNQGWKLHVPDQQQCGAAVNPIDPYCGADVVLEVHSHHRMKAFFSRQDDLEEQAGFRLYSVIGDFDRKPTILTRVGVYGHFQMVHSKTVFEMPTGLMDGLAA